LERYADRGVKMANNRNSRSAVTQTSTAPAKSPSRAVAARRSAAALAVGVKVSKEEDPSKEKQEVPAGAEGKEGQLEAPVKVKETETSIEISIPKVSSKIRPDLAEAEAKGPVKLIAVERSIRSPFNGTMYDTAKAQDVSDLSEQGKEWEKIQVEAGVLKKI
jgi:hypothetical protein